MEVKLSLPVCILIINDQEIEASVLVDASQLVGSCSVLGLGNHLGEDRDLAQEGVSLGCSLLQWRCWS